MGTKYKGNPEEIQALDTFIKLMRATNTVEAQIRNSLSTDNLTTSQFGILETLLHLGPLQQNDIARKLLKTGGNVTTVIDNLEKRNLVKRNPHPDDRRCYIVSLTPSGKQLIFRLFPLHLKTIVQSLKNLSLKEQKILETLLKKLGTGKK